MCRAALCQKVWSPSGRDRHCLPCSLVLALEVVDPATNEIIDLGLVIEAVLVRRPPPGGPPREPPRDPPAPSE